MDIYKAILELRAERDRLDRAIAALEQRGSREPKPRGRRSWNGEARRAAAERMKRYWEQRKQQPPAQNGTHTNSTE
ncbi:MAG TPA: hypothetical protein VL285_09585 [Bryobacteraceae bacterium]|nr:hypothetical protein [Bryobacteraceae bacterium]